MTKLKANFKGILAFLMMTSFLFTSCNKDGSTGTSSFKITDAPMNDANVKAVFVTVADLKLDGESVEGFSKQTIELSSYQNGKTELLFNGEIEAGSYSEATLVLDYEKDEDGNAPGTYVVTAEDQKQELSNSSSGSGEFTSKIDMELEEDGNEKMVIDFDLRKAIRYKNGSDNEYELVAQGESSTVIRAVNEDNAGKVEGKAEDKSTLGVDGQFVALLYKKGEYNESTETSGEAKFQNAITSSMVNENQEYTLAFVEEGNYELHFANYEDSDNDGKSEFKGMLDISLGIAGDLNNVTVGASANVKMDIDIMGLL